MSLLLVFIFVATYTAIVLEHPLRINKSASALLGAGLLWTVYALATDNPSQVSAQLNASLTSTAQIVFFLMGAMTIVEVIDAHDGFSVITSRIRTTRLSHLLFLVAAVTFFLSAILDNLTTAIIMVSLMKKLLGDKQDRLYFAGIIIIAANAGGAWTPIGDVTTTMLWIGGQITTAAIMKAVFIASLINLLVPVMVIAIMFGQRGVEPPNVTEPVYRSNRYERNLMFYLGLLILVCVPAFKTYTNLPPFMGILSGLGLLWLVGDIVHREKQENQKEALTLVSALKRIDLSSIIFFVGILLVVACLEHAKILTSLGNYLQQTIGRLDVIVVVIGLVSAVVDNVPLVAASMGMYSIEQYPADSFLWEFMAYCAGTGGSILIIGSAAGVAAMGLEKIEFFWYLRKISLIALLGYLAGAFTYAMQYYLLH